MIRARYIRARTCRTISNPPSEAKWKRRGGKTATVEEVCVRVCACVRACGRGGGEQGGRRVVWLVDWRAKGLRTLPFARQDEIWLKSCMKFLLALVFIRWKRFGQHAAHNIAKQQQLRLLCLNVHFRWSSRKVLGNISKSLCCAPGTGLKVPGTALLLCKTKCPTRNPKGLCV